MVSLTDSGRTVFAEFFPVARSINLRLLEGLDRAELARLDAALILMHANAVAVAHEAQLPKADRRRGRTG